MTSQDDTSDSSTGGDDRLDGSVAARCGLWSETAEVEAEQRDPPGGVEEDLEEGDTSYDGLDEETATKCGLW